MRSLRNIACQVEELKVDIIAWVDSKYYEAHSTPLEATKVLEDVDSLLCNLDELISFTKVAP